MIFHTDYWDPALLEGYDRLPRPKGNPHGRGKNLYYRDVVCAFDIETTTEPDEEVNYMYIWQFQLGLEYTFYGRTWQEFRDFLESMLPELGEDRLVIYVHNLSYEWQYIKNQFSMRPEDVFAVDARKVLKCTIMDHFEFRDSLALTNMSLDQFTRKMGVKHQKLSGEDFNYIKIRYPWTELTEKELEYCTNDVLGLVEAVTTQMERDGDTLYTIPLTSTGYPRREMKYAMRRYPREKIQEIQPTYEQYKLLRDAFRGGNTHASRFYSRKLIDSRQIKARILSADRSSSYPDVLINCKFPMGRWKRGECSVQNLKNLIENGYAVIFRCTFYKIELKNPRWPVPYLSSDKGAHSGALYDNGRILKADWYSTALTDLDFRIILYEYEFNDMDITEMYFTEYGYLPDPMRAVILSYYTQKTALKGKEDPFDKLLYEKSKNMLNGLYGLMAQDPVKQSLIWNGREFELSDEDPEEVYKKATRNAFATYSHGVYTTCWARVRLEQMIIVAGPENFLYCDTDSCKYIDHGQSWDDYNLRRRADSIANGAYAEDSKGITHYMGVAEPDGEYSRFITLGSKRYAYDDMDGQLHITVSGVSKKAGAKELGRLENFREGFIFYHPGKTEASYNDFPIHTQIIREGKAIELVSYVIIRETTYNLSISESYANLLRLVDRGHNY